MSCEIAGVLFDLGGTLVDYGGPVGELEVRASAYRAVYETVISHGYRGDPVSFQEQLWQLEDPLWQEAKAGRRALTLEAELAELFERIDLGPDPALVAAAAEGYCRIWQASCAAYPDSLRVLQKLNADGLKIGLVSNTALPGRVHAADLDRFGLLSYFDDLVFSSEVGLWKPQPEVFELALSRLGLRAEVAVFVGDRLIDDVVGAQRAGLRGILIAREEAEGLGGDEREARTDTSERERGAVPDARIRTLFDLPEALARLVGGKD